MTHVLFAQQEAAPEQSPLDVHVTGVGVGEGDGVGDGAIVGATQAPFKHMRTAAHRFPQTPQLRVVSNVMQRPPQ